MNDSPACGPHNIPRCGALDLSETVVWDETSMRVLDDYFSCQEELICHKKNNDNHVPAMRTEGNRDSIAAETAVSGHQYFRHGKSWPGFAWVARILIGLLLWLSFVKLPATAVPDRRPEPWETVLSFAAAHHLQWGRDVIFSYGPLGFLTSDYYWGNFYWPILLWAFGFSLLLTFLLLRFLDRVILPTRLALYAALPLLTVPRWGDLGIDPIYLFAITLIGVTCLPREQAGVARLVISGLMLGCLSLIKFTFCLYSIVVLLTIAATHFSRGRLWPAGIVIGSSMASFLTAWSLAGQNIPNIWSWFQSSLQIVSGYSSAMSIVPGNVILIAGLLIWLCLLGMLCVCGFGAPEPLAQKAEMGLLGAGIFLAWKEAFVRADGHVVIFLLYAFLTATLMPALLRASGARQRRLFPLTAATLILAVVPLPPTGFVTAIKAGAIPKLSDTLVALFAPVDFQHRLEVTLESFRLKARLPQIAATVGNAPVAVLSYDQDVAILNGFNYHPHPVFQNYSAYTPKLQHLNSSFFDSETSPEYVLWRYATIDGRFPTLDDGQILLRILHVYLPVESEKGYVLWKRDASRGRGYVLHPQAEVQGFLDQWLAIPREATWLKIEMHETWFGTIRKFLCRAAEVRMDVRLENGQTRQYRLLPSNASSGFVVSPLFPFIEEGKPICVTAVKIYSMNRWCFDDSVRIVKEEIQGVPALQCESDTH